MPTVARSIIAGLACAFALLASAGALAAGPGEARQSTTAAASHEITTVLELFTSQGCSSCPPADKLLKGYLERPDVMALSFPVDYWDYLGWKDTFASPRYSERQRDYARARGDGAVYTPQVVVNGWLHVVGSAQSEIDKAVTRARTRKPLTVPVEARAEGETVVITAGAASDGETPASATVWLVVVQPEGKVEIRRGENSGKSLTYYNVVRELAPVGMWSGTASEFRLAKDSLDWPGSPTRCAVLVQAADGGPILGAAWLPE